MDGEWALEAGTVLAASGDLSPGHVTIAGGRIAAAAQGPARAPRYRFPNAAVAPGFIDLQVNGCAGVDFASAAGPDDLAPAARHLLRTGVTAFLPTVITGPVEAMRRAVSVIARARWRRPAILGVHVEGPFLSPPYCGAHDPAHLLAPEVGTLDRLLDGFDGLVRLVTLAPELPGAGELVDALRRRGIVASAGHTGADLDAARAAFDRGLAMVTHLFNAMRPFEHRDPGIVGAALVDRRIACGLILDGIHVHPAAAAIALRLLGPERAVLVTDAVAAAGAPPGRYRLAGRDVVSDGTTVTLDDGTLAGSALTMDRAVALAVDLGWTVRDAVRMASATPARLLGLAAKGALAPGADADLVVLDAALGVEMTVCGGEVAYRRGA